MTTTNRSLQRFVALGLAGSLASIATAQPFQINGSGATLLQATFEAPASTNDWIDADGNGISISAGTGLQNLADNGDCTFPFDPANHWFVSYRVIGSANGFAELRDWGFTFATAADGITPNANATLNADFSDKSIWNRREFVNGGVVTDFTCYSPDLPGGTPFVTFTDARFPQVSSDRTAIGAVNDPRGMLMDFSTGDVPAPWLVFQPGAPKVNAVPNAPGYGANPRLATRKDGLFTTSGFGNMLKDPSGFNGPINFNTSAPDAFTVFDSAFTVTPVSAIVNYGVGMTQIAMSDLRHLSATGRRLNGENLTAVTRDSGSGTRNAFMNGICLDPSWGAGENIGSRTVDKDLDKIGALYQPSNKGGSSRLEDTIFNTRLGIGHTGAERGVSKAWITGSNPKADVLAVISDLKGGTNPARPNSTNVLDGGADGYNIAGIGTIATIGDPMSVPAALGGLGFPEPFQDGSNGQPLNGQYDLGEDFVDLNNNGTRDSQTEPRPAPGDLNPAPRNPQVGAYINNFSRSIQGFETLSGDPNDPLDLLLFSPGEFLVVQFILTASPDNIPNINPDPNAACVDFIPNPNQNPAVRDFATQVSVLARSEYQTFNTSATGKVPVRLTLPGNSTYDDGVLGGQNYIDQAGNIISYGSNLTRRNLIAGDFNGDALRDINDAADMIRAWDQRHGSATVWAAPNGQAGSRIAGESGSDAIIEVLGDFNCDGNFDSRDIRYWADGLAMVPDGAGGTVLDRVQGFTAVDTASDSVGLGLNFFATVLANPSATYDAGDSRADIAGPTVHRDPTTAQILGTTRGWEPTGADGLIDGDDITYVYEQFKAQRNTHIIDGQATWTDTFEAVFFDLSADINGDLVVDQNDVFAILAILETTIGDVDLSGSCDATDLSIAIGNLGMTPARFQDGDVNGDNVVNQADVDIIDACANPCLPDLTGSINPNDPSFGIPDGTLDANDFFYYLDLFAQGDPEADLTGSIDPNNPSYGVPDGTLDANDFFFYLNLFAQGCP